MCGITGFWRLPGGGGGRLDAHVEAMSMRLRHRGPDDSGYWCDENVGVALAQRRLSVLDLSAAGHQPMHSACGRYVAVFNGEIYNHLELRDRLAKQGDHVAWRGHSDTETLVACIAAWGIEKTLRSCVGMFALVLWDRQQRELTLARDRMGEKPLYYGWQDDTLLFGSELKALKAYPAFRPELDRNALALYLRHDCIPAPHTIYRGYFKLRPGHLLRISARAWRDVEQQPYWRYNDAVDDGFASPFDGNDAEAIDALEGRLSESIGRQLLSDVPLGAFLSGGVDSSTVVALMQARSQRPVKTFTIGFAEGRYDEAAHARAVASHLGTDHTELYVSPADALAVIPKLPSIFCEPFADSSQIPTFLISQLARRAVTVALSGDGGDELFGGYNRYLAARTSWGRMQRLPLSSRRALARLLRSVTPHAWDSVMERVKPILPQKWHLASAGDKVHKLSEVLTLSSGQAYLLNLASCWQDPMSVVVGAVEPATVLTDPSAWPQVDDLAQWMMAVDAQSYLPDDILVKVDRSAMANSLETRVPMLDHQVVEFALRTPLHLKIRDGQGKWILRQVLHRYVPRALIERPKMGFALPMDQWLRGPLRDWAEALLDERRLKAEGYFAPAPIRKKWKEHLSGRRNWQRQLWTVLMFQGWLDENQGAS